MSSIKRLTEVSAPFLAAVAEPKTIAAEARKWVDSALVVRTIRGAKCRTRMALFDEFAAAFQFPLHFGEIWSAFAVCISDLDRLPFHPGIVVVVVNSDLILVDAPRADLVVFVDVMASAAEEFGRTIADGEWWDREPAPFHLVLQQATDDYARWRHSGANLESLTL